MSARCGHRRGVPDLLGRGDWLCEKPAGHRGEHVAFKGSDWCRWGDDGFALPEDEDEAVEVEFIGGAS